MIDVTPPEPLLPAARALFSEHLPLAVRYARLLATEGTRRGLIGPRETPRLWDRHLLNCAVIISLIPGGSYVLDVGSGAGLPGIVLAVARPDLTVTLVEPLARRTGFLTEAVTDLDLTDRVGVVRARADELAAGAGRAMPPGRWVAPADVVTARALAPLDRLAGWCLPLVAVGGRVLAIKGASAADEVEAHRTVVGELGGGPPVIRRCGAGLVEPPATVVEIVRERAVGRSPGHRRLRAGGGAGRGRR